MNQPYARIDLANSGFPDRWEFDMPRTETRPIVVPQLELEAITTPLQARDALRQFAEDNGFVGIVFDRTMWLLEQVARADGTEITIWLHIQGGIHRQAHDLFEQVVATPLAHDLAIIAVDARPGTVFSTHQLPDACGASAKLV